jgi:hypothetical protein
MEYVEPASWKVIATKSTAYGLANKLENRPVASIARLTGQQVGLLLLLGGAGWVVPACLFAAMT